MEKSKNTLSYLNSKWYWRLIKVIGVFLYILILILSSVGIYLEIGHYSPIKLEKAKNIIIEKSDVSNLIEYVKINLPGNDLKLKDFKKIIAPEKLGDIEFITARYITMIYLGKNMNDVIVCNNYNCEDSDTYDISNLINENKSGFITIGKDTYENLKESYDNIHEIEKNAAKSINNLINGKSYSYNFYTFNNFDEKYNTNINNILGDENEYKSLLDYIKIIFSILGVLLGIFIFNFILLRIIYYIALGSIFPKKD